RRHTRCYRDWSSDVCSSDLVQLESVVLETPQGESWTIDPAKQAGGTLKGNQPVDVRFTVHVAPKAGFTRPYFTRPDIEQAYYDRSEERRVGEEGRERGGRGG